MLACQGVAAFSPVYGNYLHLPATFQRIFLNYVDFGERRYSIPYQHLYHHILCLKIKTYSCKSFVSCFYFFAGTGYKNPCTTSSGTQNVARGTRWLIPSAIPTNSPCSLNTALPLFPIQSGADICI